MTFPRLGIIHNRVTQSFAFPTIAAASPTGGGFGGGGSTGGATGNSINNSINFSNQEVKYYKINLEETVINIYGESLEKWYYPANQVKCLIERGMTSYTDDDFGSQVAQTIILSIPRDYLQIYNLLPEVGDIIMDRERYYEINNVDIHFVTISGARTPNTTQGTHGQTAVYTLSGYLTRITKINILEYT